MLLSQIGHIKEDERIGLLVLLLAQNQMISAFERIYRLIIGSQIAGLRQLNSVAKANIFDAVRFFENVKEKWPQEYENVEFDSWIDFLRRFNLIQQSDEIIEITDLGRDFLSYLKMQRLSEAKPY